ncbi:P-loop containing nucleoside triphosphate hydrolase protein [Lipomyces tetrasporus]
MIGTASLRSRFTRGTEVLKEQAGSYLRKVTEFLDVLFILMHVTYGSPARMTEINTWKVVNSVHNHRNIYCHARGLILLGLYNKTTSLTGMERFIIHLLPARLEKLFLSYLIYIRPFEKLLAGGLYKVNNYIIEGYQQYLFTGYKGRFGAERLREIIQQKTSLSTTLHTKLNAQELRQALVAFLDQFAGHSKAVGSDNEDYAHDIQSGHSSRMAITHYAISDQDLPSTNRYDVHVFMLVSEAWFELLGEESPGKGLKKALQTAQPSGTGQSVEQSIPAIRQIDSNTVERATIIRETIEVYPESVDAKLLPVVPATFQLLYELRGTNARFLSPLQAAAIQTIISNPGHSFLVVLPTGGGKSDIVYLTSLYEFKNRRMTILVVPFVALRYDIIDRASKLGLRIVQWSPSITTSDITGTHILVVSVDNLDGNNFRRLFSELLVTKGGHSLVARVIFDEAHTILGHWEFRPSFHAIQHITSLTIPVVLLSATIPPNRVREIRKLYNRLDLRLIRSQTTMRPNIGYEVYTGAECRQFFRSRNAEDRALVFCMSKDTVKTLYDHFLAVHDKIGFFSGDLTPDMKADILEKWIRGLYVLVFTTSGLGVGIDYGSVSLVIHYEGLWGLLDYVQESGRAGRKGDKASNALVITRKDWHPNYKKLTAGDAMAIDDYLSPDGFCRR